MHEPNTILPLTVAMFVGTVAMILGTMATIITKKLNMNQAKFKEVNEIANSLANQANASKAKALEILVNKLPEIEDVDNFSKNIEDLLYGIEIHNKINLKQTPDLENFSQNLLNVEELINGYHQQALAQARTQFWFSIFAATVGFGWILLAALQINPANLSSYLQTTPGIVIDAVAYLFIRQAEATRERATALYDRLRADNQQVKAIKLVDSIEDQKIKSIIKAQLSLHMAGLNQNFIDLSEQMKNIFTK